jgi:hypothetical protein
LSLYDTNIAATRKIATIKNTVENPKTSAIIPPTKGSKVNGNKIKLVRAKYDGLSLSETVYNR